MGQTFKLLDRSSNLLLARLNEVIATILSAGVVGAGGALMEKIANSEEEIGIGAIDRWLISNGGQAMTWASIALLGLVIFRVGADFWRMTQMLGLKGWKKICLNFVCCALFFILTIYVVVLWAFAMTLGEMSLQ